MWIKANELLLKITKQTYKKGNDCSLEYVEALNTLEFEHNRRNLLFSLITYIYEILPINLLPTVQIFNQQ